ncbi:MAG: hypothetical protein K8F33_00240 [Thermomonas sp.]|nr:hypothetical protein [Thermomonas sp.]
MFMRSLVAAAAILCAVPAAAAQCPYWEIEGDYVIRQSNAIDVALHLVREGNKLTGQARFYSTSFGHEIAGPLEGYIDGDRFHFRVSWYQLKQKTCLKYDGLIPVWCWTDKYDENGIYEGTISAHGEVQGNNYPFERPNARTSWFMKSELECQEIVMLPRGALDPSRPAPPVELHREVVNMSPLASERQQNARIADVTPNVGVDAALARPVQPGPAEREIRVLGQRQPRDTCLSGYVWREARASDHVCVTPQSRQRAAQENRLAASRRNPAGAYGPETCVSGFVWREAYEGDTVCVVPSVRAQVREENRLARSRRKSH